MMSMLKERRVKSHMIKYYDIDCVTVSTYSG